MKLCFVILHYQNIDDTINCIESIKKLKNNNNIDYSILIVDNCSPNCSGAKLKEIYNNENNIVTILLDRNYGFSKANNIGYEYARDNHSDVIIVCNNDIIFEDINFLNKIYKITTEKKDEIIIPDVINYNNIHQNPMKENEYSLLSAIKNYLYKRIMSILLLLPVFNNFFFYINELKEKKWQKKYSNIELINSKYFVPIGAFIIYNKSWINKEKQAFPSNTFMYCEEDFLIKYIKKNEYSIIYDNSIKIRHLEGRSTNTLSNNKCIKLSKKFAMQASALNQYIRYICEKR